MKGYILSAAAAALICALAEALIPDDAGLKKAVSLAVGAVLVITLLLPLKSMTHSFNFSADNAETGSEGGGNVSEEYRQAVAYRVASAAAEITEEKVSVSRRFISVSVNMPDGAAMPDSVTVTLSGDGLWAASAALEEYLTEKLGIECKVEKAGC